MEAGVRAVLGGVLPHEYRQHHLEEQQQGFDVGAGPPRLTGPA
jgi:hypothetical protein